MALPTDTTPSSAVGQATGGGLRDKRQFISFRVGAEDYAIDIMYVREIKGWSETTSLPNQPDYLLGVLNLRGSIVPIFDLSRRLGMAATVATRTHVVVIVAVAERTVGLLVDAVSDILSVDPAEIKPVPDVDATISTELLSGIITVNDTMVVLLALESLFSRQTLQDVAALAA
jgi:purine-binding chemotaxis protein CheW